MRFHTQLADAEAARPASLEMTHMIVGVRQPTGTTVRITGAGYAELGEAFGGENDYGDATVPLVGALGHRLSDSNRVRRIADHHGNLSRNRAALDEVESVLTGRPIRRRDAAASALRVDAPGVLSVGEPLLVDVTVDDASRQAVRVVLTDEAGRLHAVRLPRLRQGHATGEFPDLAPGAYTIDVGGPNASSPLAPVSTDVIVS
jgi:hypothetical protein